MAWLHVFWDFEPGGNAEHIAENGLDPDEVEHVLMNPNHHEVSRSSGREMIFGYTPSGEYVAVAYEEIDDLTVYPVTAYRIQE